MSLSEQEKIRRNSLDKLKELDINPYPADGFELSHFSEDIISKFDELEGQEVRIAGRMMSRRIMGKASFAKIQDTKGSIQFYINRDEICPGEDKTMYNTVFKKLLDIGDILGVAGKVFKTQTGEVSVHVRSIKILSKSLRPLPLPKEKDGNIYDAFTDPEKRYRMRYVDLIVNPQHKEIFLKRTKIYNVIRDFLNEKGYIEVETPILQSIPGGAAARPFVTHHNALDIPLYLRIANELYLKRLIVGGFDGVYEFAKDFRNEGMDRTHNPEFSQIELYVAYKDYEWMMDMTEELLEKAAIAVYGRTKFNVGQSEVDFKRPWKRISLFDAIKEYTGEEVVNKTEEELAVLAKSFGIEVDKSMGKAKLIDEIFGAKVEHQLINPTFITDYPEEMSPLTKKHRSKPGLTERFELIINKKEIANCYSELNDPIDQRKRFEDQAKLMERGDDEAMYLDEDFLRALEFGMPPTAGIGIGLDRLVMLLTNQESIQEVLFFPQMKPETKA